MWDLASHCRKEWHALAQEHHLLAPHHLSIMELRGLIPKAELFKMNIGCLGYFGGNGVGALVVCFYSMTPIVCILCFIKDLCYPWS
jgi:hypothetical protein